MNAVAFIRISQLLQVFHRTLAYALTQQFFYAMYKQLASPTTIRVLHVHPAPETDPLTCSLEHCDLDSDPEYEAISYVWGHSDLSCSITCDSKITSVTRSLHEAILRVRLPDRLRKVWIDGLCINQTDGVEKSHQVRLMKSVYRNAYRVLVWLGPDPYNNARKAFDICLKLGQRDVDPEELKTMLTKMGMVGGTRRKLAERWRPILYLSSCPWWTRVWIMQEFSLAKDLLFLWGGEEIQWTHINLAVCNLQKPDITWRYLPFKSTVLKPISQLSAIKDQRCYAMSFMGMIHTARGFKCSDHRDRIFGILGLGHGDDRWAAADPSGRSLAGSIIPDYSLPVEHVYRQFAILALQRGLTEGIFLAVQHGLQLQEWQPGDMPSWSPRWNLPVLNDFPCCHGLHEICKFDGLAVENGISFRGSVSERLSVLQSDFDPLAIHTLNVLSATVDSIVALSDSMFNLKFRISVPILESFWEKHIRPGEEEPGYKAVMTDLCENATYYMTSENHVSVFYAASQDPCKRFPESIANFARNGDNALLRSVAQLLLKMNETAYVQDPFELQRQREAHSYLKRFFITRQGYLGMCPSAAQPGDHVALLWHTDCPMILRPQDDFYRIVGSSYMAALSRKKVEGVPHLLDDILSGKSKPEMIQIR